jgi:site-specific recombinase XerC
VLPLSINVRRSLAAWLVIRPSEGCHSSEWLFLGDDGKQLTTRAVQKRMQAVGASAGVKFSPHSLRHTFVHGLIDAGRPLGEVQDLARHGNLKTTLRYGKAGWDELEAAVEARDSGKRRNS